MRKLILLTTCILLVILFSPFSASAQFYFQAQNTLTGKTAPDFSLPTLNGQKVGMTQYRAGNSAVIFFWATWCPNSHEQLKRLNKVAAEMKNKGIQVILVDVAEDAKTVSAYIKRNNLPYEVFLDEGSKVAEDYSIVGVPTLFFVGKDGVVKSVENVIPDNFEEILMQ